MSERPQLLVVALVVLLAGCGGGGDRGEAPAVRAAPVTTAAGGGPVPAIGTTVSVERTFWFAGFKLTVHTAALREEAGGRVVTMATTFENLGPERSRFDGEVVLQSQGRTHALAGAGDVRPEVRSGASADGAIEIGVDLSFRFDDAVLVAGGAGLNQAKVPVGRSGPLISLEPQPLPLSGRLATPALTLDLRGGELRYDWPRRHRETEVRRRALRVSYTQSAKPCRTASLTYHLDLERPDHTTANAEESGPFGQPEGFVAFTVNDPPSGTYILRLDGKVTGSTGPACPAHFSAETTFTV